MGKKANPDGIGARVTWQAGDWKRSRLKVGGGYLAAHDPREVRGIGPRTKVERLEVRWPQPIGRGHGVTPILCKQLIIKPLIFWRRGSRIMGGY